MKVKGGKEDFFCTVRAKRLVQRLSLPEFEEREFQVRLFVSFVLFFVQIRVLPIHEVSVYRI